jgi:hypothetical protein
LFGSEQYDIHPVSAQFIEQIIYSDYSPLQEDNTNSDMMSELCYPSASLREPKSASPFSEKIICKQERTFFF